MSSYFHTYRSAIVSSKPCILYGVNVYRNSGNDASIRIYDGVDASSGRLIATVGCPQRDSRWVDFNTLDCPRGIYVEVVERVQEITVIYDVLSEAGVSNNLS